MSTIRIGIEAVRFTDQGGFTWMPYGYLEDPTVRTGVTIETSKVDDIATAVATLRETFPYQCKVFVRVTKGRKPNGFNGVRNWGDRKTGDLHPYYAKEVAA